ncbi:flavodoxin family protein [Anaerovorax odorimutans]|uniref:flavodoxin family protein n=1 Tax=Anaerovorax odorimutans TaxID=109327 RepID=UPI000417479A|nr:flavodoxin family protein [Anaerovorax odorimutans]
MRILAINSSFRGSKGVSAFLIDKLFIGAIEKGAECETIHLAELQINHCIDCQLCQTPKHLLKCTFDEKDNASFVFRKMREADLIIFATPVYVLGMSSLLKTLFERFYSTAKVGEFHFTKSGMFFHHGDQSLTQKPFVPLVVYDNLETEMPKNIISYFKTYSKFTDAELVGTLIRKSAGMLDVSASPTSNHTISDSIFQAYVQAGRELVTQKKISKLTEKKANQPIIRLPFFVKPMLKLGIGKEQIEKGHARMMKSVMKRDKF